MAKPKLNFHSKKPLLFQLLEIRKRMNKDTIAIIVGEKRIGKSFAALKICERIDPNFDANKQVFFDVKPFLEWFHKTSNSIAVLDEVSVAYSNREWYSIQNRIFRTLLTTQGYKRNILLLTLPTISHLDKSAVDLSHLLLMGVDTGIFRVYRIKTNQLSRKTYPMGFEVLKFDLPSQKTLDIYNHMKDEWNKGKLSEDLDFISQLQDVENYHKQLSLADYLKGFSLGLMQFEDVKKKIMRMGYGEKDVEMVLKMEQQKMELKQQQNVETTPENIF